MTARAIPASSSRAGRFGVLQVTQREDGKTFRNDRVLFVPMAAPRQKNMRDVLSLSKPMKDELEGFFQAAIAGTGKEITFEGLARRESRHGGREGGRGEVPSVRVGIAVSLPRRRRSKRDGPKDIGFRLDDGAAEEESPISGMIVGTMFG